MNGSAAGFTLRHGSSSRPCNERPCSPSASLNIVEMSPLCDRLVALARHDPSLAWTRWRRVSGGQILVLWIEVPIRPPLRIRNLTPASIGKISFCE